MKFTDLGIRAIKPRAERFEVYADTGDGFGIRVSPTGAKTWISRYRRPDGKLVRVTLGRYPEFSLAVAREKHNELRKQIRQGGDPRAEARRAKHERLVAPTVEALAGEYLERWAQPNKASWREDERMLVKDVIPGLGDLKVADVHRRDVIALLDRISDRGAPIAANRTAALLSRMFNFAVERGVIESSPCFRLPTHQEHHRERALTEAEIRVLWIGLDAAEMSEATRLALKLILVTGQRPGEVIGMTEAELAGDVWTIGAERIKTRHKHRADHHVPLSPLALYLIAAARRETGSGDLLFPSPRRRPGEPRRAVDERSLSRALRRNLPGGEATTPREHGAPERPPALDLEHFTPHDLRRTCRTQLAALGILDVVAERVMNHSLVGMGRVYNQHGYLSEMREALNAWALHIEDLVTGRDEPSVSEAEARQ